MEKIIGKIFQYTAEERGKVEYIIGNTCHKLWMVGRGLPVTDSLKTNLGNSVKDFRGLQYFVVYVYQSQQASLFRN